MSYLIPEAPAIERRQPFSRALDQGIWLQQCYVKCYLMGVLCREIRFALLSGRIFRCITNVDIICDSFVAKVLRCCESFGILLNRFGI